MYELTSDYFTGLEQYEQGKRDFANMGPAAREHLKTVNGMLEKYPGDMYWQGAQYALKPA